MIENLWIYRKKFLFLTYLDIKSKDFQFFCLIVPQFLILMFIKSADFIILIIIWQYDILSCPISKIFFAHSIKLSQYFQKSLNLETRPYKTYKFKVFSQLYYLILYYKLFCSLKFRNYLNLIFSKIYLVETYFN
jgi:hypothetical protein